MIPTSDVTCQFIGRLVKDAQVSEGRFGPEVVYRVAVERPWTEYDEQGQKIRTTKVAFINCYTGNMSAQKLTKGTAVYVLGVLNWEERPRTYCKVDETGRELPPGYYEPVVRVHTHYVQQWRNKDGRKTAHEYNKSTKQKPDIPF
jgi:hypothetical protein